MYKSPKKTRALPAGTHAATPEVAKAILLLIDVRLQQADLKITADALRKIIMGGGCGYAHGYRTYIYHQPAGTRYSKVKARDRLKIFPYTVPCEGTTA